MLKSWEVMLLVFLLASVWVCEGRRVPPWQLKIAERQGPNTCAVEEVPGTNKKYWTECKFWMNREICGGKTVIRYECCEGYQMVHGKHGCTGVKPMTNVLQTAHDLGATQFFEYIKEAGLSDRLQHPREAITLFAPSNEAFERLQPEQLEALKTSLKEARSPFLLYHVVGRKLHSRDFHSNLQVDSLNEGHSLRINRYAHGMTTVNCAPIIRKDQEATNGIVHLIDEVLIPPSATTHQSLAELLFTDGRFREFARAMIQSNYVNELRRGGPYTLMAPTDEALDKIPPLERQRMTADPEARLALLKNHVVPHIICPAAILDTHKMKTTLGDQKVHFQCNKTGVYVDDARITSEVMLGSNGVITIIDEVLVPDRAKSVMELAEGRRELSTFTNLMKDANMDKLLLQPNVTVTVFAPSNSAFKRLSDQEMEILTDEIQKTRDLLQYHVVQGRVKTDSISDNQRVETFDRQSSLRLKVYRKEVGVESAIIQDGDIEGQNGVLHIVDHVLTPPNQRILEMLESNGEFSMLADAIHRVREVEPHFMDTFSSPDAAYTVFAPTNKAFQELGKDNLHSLMKNKRRLKKMIQNHVVDNMFATSSIHSQLLYDVKTEYQMVKVHKEKGGLMVNDAHVIKPDVLTKDGIVHCIDQVLVPEGRKKS